MGCLKQECMNTCGGGICSSCDQGKIIKQLESRKYTVSLEQTIYIYYYLFWFSTFILIQSLTIQQIIHIEISLIFLKSF